MPARAYDPVHADLHVPGVVVGADGGGMPLGVLVAELGQVLILGAVCHAQLLSQHDQSGLRVPPHRPVVAPPALYPRLVVDGAVLGDHLQAPPLTGIMPAAQAAISSGTCYLPEMGKASGNKDFAVASFLSLHTSDMHHTSIKNMHLLQEISDSHQAGRAPEGCRAWSHGLLLHRSRDRLPTHV